MARRIHFIIILAILCSLNAAWAQPRGKLSIKDNHLVLKLDPRAASADIDSMLKAAGIQGVTAATLKKGKPLPKTINGWHVKRLGNNTLLFEKPLPKTQLNVHVNPYVLTTSIVNNENAPGYPADVLYGVNSFSRNTVFELPSGRIRFILPGHADARRVVLSGSFNNWSTIHGLMLRTDSGWISDLALEPGVYAYKFIVNGRWMRDSYNNLKEDDGYHDYNSIYYRNNYTFKLPGYPAARQVWLTGSFNNWKTGDIGLQRSGSNWIKRMYIHEGVFLYKYVVDGRAITDPTNTQTTARPDGPASVLKLGETITFKLNGYGNARNVYVAGTFNNWKPDMLPLKKTATGWVLSYTLPAGNYSYKFVVDGNWLVDPANPYKNTVGDIENSFIAVKPNYTFVLRGYGTAKNVRLSGNFNDWNPNGYALAHIGNEWRISLRLKPGKALYKFLVDGQWIRDPDNRQWEQNEYGTGNSVIWIDR